MLAIEWGWLIEGAFVASGLGAGSYLTGFIADIKGRDRYEAAARLGAHLSWPPAGLSLLLLFIDLERLEPTFGFKPFTVLNNIPTSMMSLGALFLMSFFLWAVLTSVAFWRAGWARGKLRIAVWVVGSALAVLVAFYPGLLMAFSYGAIFWRSPFLVWLFAASAVLGGIALVGLSGTRLGSSLFPRLSLHKDQLAVMERYGGYAIIATALLLAAHIGYAAIFESGVLRAPYATLLILAGPLAGIFWATVVVGLAVPGALVFLGQRLTALRAQDAALIAFLLVLIGAIFLRFALLAAGQLVTTFPPGI